MPIFEALISTHGVGPSLGLAILSTHSPNQLAQILADQDSDALCVVPESERKQLRLIVELQSKIDSASIPLKNNELSGEGISSQDSGLRDVRDALSGLGYA